jgi:anti-sigma factor RsiW
MREDGDMNLDGMSMDHDIEQLVALAMGLSDASDRSAAEAHLAGCPTCRQELQELREIDAAIRRVPPEAFLEGPPADADLVLQRVLREVRAPPRLRSGAAAASSVWISGADARTGAELVAAVAEAGHGVRLTAVVVGVPAGERCTLVVIDRTGTRYTAVRWIAPECGGGGVQGSAPVRIDHVVAVAVLAADGSGIIS